MVLGEEECVLFREVSPFQGCPYRGVPLYVCACVCVCVSVAGCSTASDAEEERWRVVGHGGENHRLRQLCHTLQGECRYISHIDTGVLMLTLAECVLTLVYTC